MSTRLFTSVVALMLSITLITSSAFLIAPQKAYAQGVPTMDWVTELKTTISAIESVLNTASTYTNTAANYANMINAYVLQPLAFVLSGNLMKALTSSVIGFVIGKANGTGVPQFVTDLQRSMQTVADGRALAYLRQINQTQSPFSSSIKSALASNYLSKTSLAGFWAANMNTLARSSPNVPAYLSGNWSQGGVAAWFALTTQTQNNPYTLAQNAREQLGTIVGPGAGGATGSRAQELSFGQGFMSWCGGESTAIDLSNDTSTDTTPVCPAGQTEDLADHVCVDGDGKPTGAVPTAPKLSAGVNPGDACTNKDGTSGTVQTPGSVIKDTLSKVLGGQQDQIVRMGNVGPQVNQILGNIGTVLNTVNFAASLLGGGGKQGGLLAVNSTSASRSISQLQQFAPTQDPTTGTFTTGYLGATQADINAQKAGLDAGKAANDAVGVSSAAAAANSTSGSDLADRITNFGRAWNTIKASAETASTTVTNLAKFCTSAADSEALRLANEINPDTGTWNLLPHPTNLSTVTSLFINAARKQAVDAHTALTTEIAPIFDKFEVASSTIKDARLVLKDNPTTLANPASVQTQMGTPPTMSDVSYAEQNAQAFGAPALNTDGSKNETLFVRLSSSIVDQMNNITKNAQTLQATVCNNPSAYSYPSGFGI